jgi:NADPH:quinone reductase
MRAIVFKPDSTNGLGFQEIAEPTASPNELLIEVRAFALNFVDIAFLRERRNPGEALGIEVAGTVLKNSSNGMGPSVGTRVTGFVPEGGWAERCVIEVEQLAIIPDSIDYYEAVTIPVAGVTALRAIRSLGPIAGKRILVTGASGGVGRLAVQLASLRGAKVIAHVGSIERGHGLKEIGATEIVTSLKNLEPVLGVLENIGGDTLSEAYEILEPEGCIQSIGMASKKPTTLDFERARLRGGGRIEAFNVFARGGPFGKDIGELLEHLVKKKLSPQVGWRSSWTRIDDAVAAFSGRKVLGKAVLEIDVS